MRERYTFGVEEEYQLVDPRTRALASRADEVLALDWADRVEGELQETMLEVGTPVCRSADELAHALRELRFHTATAAAVQDLHIVAAGTHPFSRWEEHETARGERPDMLLERLGLLVREEQFFGMHVHVSVPDEDERIRVLGVVRCYLPHLLALSCSSPFLEGQDTGYASYRTILNRRVPLSGPPPYLRDHDDYRRLADALINSDAVPDERTIYWSVRPSSRYPTLEFRVSDACPRVDDVVGIAALIRALVVAAAEGELDGTMRDQTGMTLLRMNEWRVAREGLDARLVSLDEPGGVPVRQAIRSLARRVAPLARQLGDQDAFEQVDEILAGGNTADRLRLMRREGTDDRELVAWLQRETNLGLGMDRRRRQREEEALS